MQARVLWVGVPCAQPVVRQSARVPDAVRWGGWGTASHAVSSTRGQDRAVIGYHAGGILVSPHAHDATSIHPRYGRQQQAAGRGPMSTPAEDLRPEASDATLGPWYGALVCTNRLLRAPAIWHEPRSAFTGGAVHHFLPHGIDELVPSATFTKDAEGGWTWGNHPGMSPQQTQHLQNHQARLCVQ